MKDGPRGRGDMMPPVVTTVDFSGPNPVVFPQLFTLYTVDALRVEVFAEPF